MKALQPCKMFNPLHWLGLFALLLISLPLVTCAILTTTLAASTLLIRVNLVYIELGFALIRSWLVVDRPSQPSTQTLEGRFSPSYSTSYRHRKRPSSASSAVSPQDATSTRKPPTASDSLASPVGAGGMDRDFEGVGGWKLSGDSHDDALWIGMNSRLELPAASGDRQRRHARSLTSGSQKFYHSPESTYMSPVQSRRTSPPMTEGTTSPEGYFSMQPNRWIGTRFEALAKSRTEERRKSLSGSNPSPDGSGKSAKGTASR